MTTSFSFLHVGDVTRSGNIILCVSLANVHRWTSHCRGSTRMYTATIYVDRVEAQGSGVTVTAECKLRRGDYLDVWDKSHDTLTK